MSGRAGRGVDNCGDVLGLRTAATRPVGEQGRVKESLFRRKPQLKTQNSLWACQTSISNSWGFDSYGNYHSWLPEPNGWNEGSRCPQPEERGSRGNSAEAWSVPPQEPCYPCDTAHPLQTVSKALPAQPRSLGCSVNLITTVVTPGVS